LYNHEGENMAVTDATAVKSGRTTRAIQRLQLVWLYILPLILKATDLVVPRRFSRVETTPFIDPHQFAWHERVTAEWSMVQSELKALLDTDAIPNHQDIVETARPITTGDNWLSHFFYIYGQRFDKQCNECPRTARLLQEIPGMKTAFFSILSAGKRIPPHRGPYRGVMRYHLPLLVPQDGHCGIRVGDQIATFEEGVVLMFDDTYEHEVWNDTSGTRVVLFLDIKRPMKFPFNIVNSVVIALMGWSPTVRKMRKNQAAFDRKVEDSARGRN
jgi:beta-hydroxylase